MGVPLNIYLYTIVMHNAVDHGDTRTALNVFQLLRAKDIEPNDYTYSVLLKGLKDGQNLEALQELIKEAGQALPKLERPHIVATDIIHCIYLNHFEPNPTNRTFADLAQTYHEYFDPSPLVKLGVPAQFFGNSEAPNRMGIIPSSPPIGIILSAYLELISKNSPEEVVRLYRIFRHQIEHSGDPALSELRGLNHYYNAFLLAMGQNASTLRLMPEILRQMTDQRVHSVPLTSEHTWDILVNAFMRHNQPEAARRVMQTMSAYDQKPNEVTWNSLVKGYGRLQDVDNVLATIRDMQLQKVQLGAFSLRVLGRMKEGDKLSKGLREIEEARRRHAEEEQDYLVPEDYQEGSNNGQNSEEEIWEAITREKEEGSNWRDGKRVLGAIKRAGQGTGNNMR
ncbi:hypothetical protein GTA08_BOTSDO00258 [Neofusicoccum parvum]|uniref:Uncharacterized protein n=1 Tax=Neofusicoccum parvum TaxID=310453 RepID=A0ACB5S1Y8_9PEZI|nr:hypothetical protein GTA08_BOTSDO00258 [Neofusicoccum parvum]